MRKICSSFITSVNLSSQWYLKQKSQDFKYEKNLLKRKIQTVHEQFVNQTLTERWKYETDCDKIRENNYNFHLI